ncbi:hypothetical protein [Methylocapsa palsarum]|uniref:PepSY-associated TM region n=1 Tax=Methylocapsa palsarum TaxID=1612308 RepID=A0A1I4BKN9_9HYPH|nr:hypothetical protein [Methylocapsa palsarum]SFK69432.1 hypothetical protein SAMN05444581_11580 [Methylocapsa palsarum]
MRRSGWVFIHRCVGLIMAGFLILVGVTESLLAFLPELDRAINRAFISGGKSGARGAFQPGPGKPNS